MFGLGQHMLAKCIAKITVDGKRNIASLSSRMTEVSALEISGYTGLAGNVALVVAGVDLSDPLVALGGACSISANLTQMGTPILQSRFSNLSENFVACAAAGQFCLSGASYIGSWFWNGEPGSIAAAGVLSMCGSLSTMFLPERMRPRVVAAGFYLMGTANAWMAASSIQTHALWIGAALLTASSVAFARSGKRTVRAGGPKPQ